MPRNRPSQRPHQLVVIGGGFGGLACARSAARYGDVEVTVVDRRSHHEFQPLLFQVATGALSPDAVRYPVQAALPGGARFVHDTVLAVDSSSKSLKLGSSELSYDSLVIAAGSQVTRPKSFPEALPLKDLADALTLRDHLFDQLALAYDRNDPAAATFLIVGGGPTGVELAGEIRRLADEEMRDAPLIPRVILVEHTDRLLPGFATRSSMAAERQLDRLGVEVRLESALKRVDSGQYVLQGAQGDLELDARTVVWAAGVHPAPVLGGLTTGEGERLRVDRRCEVEGLQGVYAIGDAAHFEQRGRVLPWIAPVALQQGAYIGRAIARRALGRRPRPFRYVHRGMIAHVGDRAAVGEVLGVPLSGLLPWALGEIVHLAFLPGLENRLLAAGDFLATTLGRRRRPSTLSRGVNVRFDAARGDFDEATLH